MKIRVFQSDKGDCLLLTSDAGTHRILVDGGMASSYSEHVAPALEKLTKAKKALDVVYVSHIDDDHIGGVLRMMDDLMDWRVFDFQRKNHNSHAKPPKSPRPPEVKAIWHNAFHELLGDNTGAIADMLAASAPIIAASRHGMSSRAFEQQSVFALSKKQALQLVNRVGPDQLDIRVNPEFKHKLMLIGKTQPALKVGKISFKIIGPFERDLKKLRDEWNDWLRESEEIIKEIRRKAKADAAELTSDVDRLLAPLTAHADEFLEAQTALAKKLGQRSLVTTPNLASLMLYAEEGNQKVLLTGDGHADDAMKGLDHYGLLQDGAVHVDVLKVPHHGSEHNMTETFAQKITADDYIFCGNGFSTNPEIDVIDAIVMGRRKAFPNKSFTLWFNSSSAITKPTFKKHMQAVEKCVSDHVKKSGGKVKTKFIASSFIDV